MTSFRFETYENIITKNHMRGVQWQQAARWGFTHLLTHKDVTVASVRQIDADTIEIIKRKD